MWSSARYDLGVSEADFWLLTPRLVFALIERWIGEQERRDYRSGVIAATLVNVNRSKKSRKAAKPEDFMPKRRAPKRAKPMSVQAGIEFVAMLNRAMGGADLRGRK